MQNNSVELETSYTSSDIHAVFGRLLARQFEEMWRALDRPRQIEIVELGPGRGLFAKMSLTGQKRNSLISLRLCTTS